MDSRSLEQVGKLEPAYTLYPTAGVDGLEPGSTVSH